MKAKAFTKGFVDGFTVPFTFFIHRDLKPSNYRVKVDSAWDDVGAAVRQSMRDEGLLVDETTTTPRRRISKKQVAA
ncbi:hypothetical protein [Mycoplana sp. MJR14]|uniref:hypothetical protein n=1 Tax=Mycoplana sp. MJR14 TaxID=3032583 RepID=UPI0023DCB22F|nr:hypothetical protein [Mycoplana sp. MJR14]MDF1633473.1 hypothetical protein [Mycoplana sp. MJR14]